MSTRELHGATETAPRMRSEHLLREDRANLLRYMALMRVAEERALTLYQEGTVPGSFYDGRGQEAISVGSSFVLGPRDRMCILHRDLGAHFVRGVTPERYFANFMGRAGGVTGGRDGNMHFGDRRLGCVGMVSMLPDMASVANGLALSFKMRGEPRVAMTYFGEGSTANGQWHEAMNFAGIHRLPVVFVLENNKYAYSTPSELEFAADPVERAAGYGFPGVPVDGNDVETVFEATRVAVDRARSGDGPTLIECHTMRMHGDGAHDDMSYVPKELVEKWAERDPIGAFENRLVVEHGFSEDEIEAIGADVEAAIQEGVRRALEQPMPEPDTALDGVFADEWEPLGDGNAPWSRWQDTSSGERKRESRHERYDLSRGDLRRAARGDAPRRHRVLPGRGHRGVRRGVQGDGRLPRGVRARPRARHAARRESDHRRRRGRGRGGPAARLRDAVRGLHRMWVRPARERGGQAALPPGRGRPDGRAAPDRRRLLRRPVPLPEPGGLVPAGARAEGGRTGHRGGRERAAGERDPRPEPGGVPGAQAPVPAACTARCRPGSTPCRSAMAQVVRPGSELSIFAYGSTVGIAQAAVEELDEDVEIVDLRTLCPLDRETILASARKTGKVLIAHEATRSCGVAAEVAALIGEEVFEDLDAPVRRLTAPDVPIPFSPPLEQHVLPGLDDMKNAVRELVAY